MRVAINRTSSQNLKITKSPSGVIQSSTPITLKNQISEISSIEDIRDVTTVDVVDGSTLVYNSENDKYEVKKLEISDLDYEDLSLDGGEF